MKNIRAWINDRLGVAELSKFGMKKEVPLHSHTIWYYTGSSILLFMGIQVVTGVMLAFYYNPTIKDANASVARIMTEIPLGWIIRSIHSWSATLMIAVVIIHLLSIAFTKAYRAPREATWMTGVFLLAASLAFGFTGYLLPWDDLSLAATKVGTDIPKSIPVVGAWVTSLLRGGEDVTGDTISRFFIVHVCVLPLAIFAILGIHGIALLGRRDELCDAYTPPDEEAPTGAPLATACDRSDDSQNCLRRMSTLCASLCACSR